LIVNTALDCAGVPVLRRLPGDLDGWLLFDSLTGVLPATDVEIHDFDRFSGRTAPAVQDTRFTFLTALVYQTANFLQPYRLRGVPWIPPWRGESITIHFGWAAPA
jgi:hypothetical protein